MDNNNNLIGSGAFAQINKKENFGTKVDDIISANMIDPSYNLDITYASTTFENIPLTSSSRGQEDYEYNFEFKLPGWVNTQEIYLQLNKLFKIYTVNQDPPFGQPAFLGLDLGNTFCGPELPFISFNKVAVYFGAQQLQINFQDGETISAIKLTASDQSINYDKQDGIFGFVSGVTNNGQWVGSTSAPSGPAKLSTRERQIAFNSMFDLSGAYDKATQVINGVTYNVYSSNKPMAIPFRLLFNFFKQKTNLPPGLAIKVRVNFKKFEYIGYSNSSDLTKPYFFSIEEIGDPRIYYKSNNLSTPYSTLINSQRLEKNLLYNYYYYSYLVPNTSSLTTVSTTFQDLTLEPYEIIIKHVGTNLSPTISTTVPSLSASFRGCLAPFNANDGTDFDNKSNYIKEIRIFINELERYKIVNTNPQDIRLIHKNSMEKLADALVENTLDLDPSLISQTSKISALTSYVNKPVKFPIRITNKNMLNDVSGALNSKVRLRVDVEYSYPLSSQRELQIFIKKRVTMSLSSDNQPLIATTEVFPTTKGFFLKEVTPS